MVTDFFPSCASCQDAIVNNYANSRSYYDEGRTYGRRTNTVTVMLFKQPQNTFLFLQTLVLLYLISTQALNLWDLLIPYPSITFMISAQKSHVCYLGTRMTGFQVFSAASCNYSSSNAHYKGTLGVISKSLGIMEHINCNTCYKITLSWLGRLCTNPVVSLCNNNVHNTCLLVVRTEDNKVQICNTVIKSRSRVGADFNRTLLTGLYILFINVNRFHYPMSASVIIYMYFNY